MFAKIKNNQVESWPIASLATEFPHTSFPTPLTEADLPENYVMVGVIPLPEIVNTQKVVPGIPIMQDNKWVQSWDIIDLTSEELLERTQVELDNQKSARAAAYLQESDPLFFQEQRGELPQGTWLAKVAEIKSRYPG